MVIKKILFLFLNVSILSIPDQAHDGLHRAGGEREGRGDRREGRGRVQHREGKARPAAKAQNHGTFREERKTGLHTTTEN